MRQLAKHVAIILVTVLLGGLLGATLIRFAPGYGVDEQELDARLSAGSIEALRRASAPDENLFLFYGHYLKRMVHGDLGTSRTLQRPIAQLLRERLERPQHPLSAEAASTTPGAGAKDGERCRRRPGDSGSSVVIAAW